MDKIDFSRLQPVGVPVHTITTYRLHVLEAMVQDGRDRVRRENRKRRVWLIASFFLTILVAALVSIRVPLGLAGLLVGLVYAVGQQVGSTTVGHAWMAAEQADNERRFAELRDEANIAADCCDLIDSGEDERGRWRTYQLDTDADVRRFPLHSFAGITSAGYVLDDKQMALGSPWDPFTLYKVDKIDFSQRQIRLLKCQIVNGDTNETAAVASS